jgi:hypothetical protein
MVDFKDIRITLVNFTQLHAAIPPYERNAGLPAHATVIHVRDL